MCSNKLNLHEINENDGSQSEQFSFELHIQTDRQSDPNTIALHSKSDGNNISNQMAGKK